MGRATTPLSDKQIKNAKPKEKQYWIFDNNSLVLEIKLNCRKVWRLRYWLRGKEKKFTIVNYPAILLTKARNIASYFPAKVQMGIDPIEEKRSIEIQQESRRRYLATW